MGPDEAGSGRTGPPGIPVAGLLPQVLRCSRRAWPPAADGDPPAPLRAPHPAVSENRGRTAEWGGPPLSGFVDKPEPAQVPGLVHLHTGKVRDLYRNEAGELVMVASDRISAFDWVLPTEIPDKGRVLTQLSLWWFEQLADLVPHHVISADVPEGAPAEWAGRTTVCRPLRMVPVECVARGYLAGSGLLEYERDRTVCGLALPEGLVDGSELPAPVFTPATKAEVGEHDENVSYEEVARQVGAETAARLRQTTLAVYSRAREIARERGLILADTKFEFGTGGTDATHGTGGSHGTGAESGESAEGGGGLVLADEVLTPDSSRYWPADRWRPGRPQPSFDKQIVRDWLTSAASGWDRASERPPPPLPPEVVERTRARYVEAYELLTGLPWQ
jgi:phosphoribosylaminoimidazole-succinocarboxamide synthase